MPLQLPLRRSLYVMSPAAKPTMIPDKSARNAPGFEPDMRSPIALSRVRIGAGMVTIQSFRT